ncbi:hypothetical protein GW17_00000235 [Ensete ventricosum]|nr:hypothetical protein GW17_00000235 [Ensete ventricosum]RZS21565.1 hypothetical protein BHM03_00054236 [Ensete ventricosum]
MLLDRESIDLVLVPAGLAILFGYHLLLLYRIFRFPHTTVIGYENHNKRAWVERMMQVSTLNPSGPLHVADASTFYISIKQPGLALYRSELSHRNLDRKQLQGIDVGSHLRGHKPDHLFREVCFPAHLLLGRLHLLHPLGMVPRPCQLHAEHTGLRHTHKLRPECSD